MPLSPELTTFTQDVQGRYICSTWEEATQDSEGIDVVVLGAGLYGAYCAAKVHELSRARFGGDGRKALRVVVLEAGPYLIHEHGQNIPNLGLNDPGIGNPLDVSSGTHPAPRNLVWGVGWRSNQPFVGQAYCVGGKGIYWGGWCPRLQPVDLQQWPQAVRDYLLTADPNDPVGRRPIDHVDPATGQMLAREDALSAYETLEYETGVAPTDDFVFDPAAMSMPHPKMVGLNEALLAVLKRNRPGIDARITHVRLAPIAVQTQSFVAGLFALDKYSSVPALVGSVRSDHSDGRMSDLRIAVVPLTHVVRLDCAPSPESPEIGTRVVERIVVRNGGAEKVLRIAGHCQVVLAMSCIESTRLALESFSLVGSGLKPVGQELIGRNFMVHLRCDIAFNVKRAKLAQFVGNHLPGRALADLLQLAALHVQCAGAHGRYQYQLFAATNAAGPDANMYRMVPDLDAQREIARGFNADVVRVVLRASGEVEGGRNAPYRDPNFDYVDLAQDGDRDVEFGHRRAWVQFNREDHGADPIWQDIHDTGHAIARALANGDAPDYGSGDFTLPALKRQQGVGTTFHDAGTLWMGDDPAASVTDVNGHFHHVTNAYCSDQGLFPTVGSANPALTGLCLARKVAADIVDRHDSFTPPAALLSGFAPQSLHPVGGWKQAPYAGMVLIDGGMIETDPAGGIGTYYLPKLLGDLELVVEWKAFRTWRGSPLVPNSGILLRMPDPSGVNFADPGALERFYDETVEVQIDETGKNYSRHRNPQAIYGDSRYKTGAVYGVAPATCWAAKALAPDGDSDRYWNTFQILAAGNRIAVSLNGSQVCETILPPGKRPRGFVGIQFHTGRVQFRNLLMKTP
jgi:choline dehydrogenase-like flavoprotein